ncbi:CwfJ C-terminus 2-domain-containing protein-like protein [Calycina marina]|uniref:CwfJ C-terminus 2-domain-containing protein-like protein n=1 Tax=Calycina marina TaxID=1763456 RepID=A0A9P7Z7C0_9HELO|nr:CwfJ C-terminus 2-domain-containing protein-like protein [Calycina marina]
MASRIIVVGEVRGQLFPVFAKLSILQAKQDFTLALITGNLFSEDDETVADLIAGKIVVPLPTYFTVGSTALPKSILDRLEKDEEICENLHYLKKRSTTKTSEGVKIVTLGGALDPAAIDGISKDQYSATQTPGDAKALYGANSADILLTYTWPAKIRRGSKIELPEGAIGPTGQECIADLCAALKPRYHFSSTEFFYEREPFFHSPTPDAPDAKSLTRFISVAAFGNPAKQKALYGFTLQPSADTLAALPLVTTASPFTPIGPRGAKRQSLDPNQNYRFNGDSYRPNGGKRRRNNQPPPTPDQCFFCLSNPTLATHLISSIADDAYLTIAKGPLTTSVTNTAHSLNFPCHLLIIPLTHSPTLALIPAEDREKTYSEMNKFKEAAQNMVAERSENKLGAVTYEISLGRGVHVHWQFLPMPVETISKGLVEAAFLVEAENHNYPPFETRDPGIGLDEGNFFRVWIWTPPSERQTEGSTKCLTMPFDDSVRFSLQFGRTALAKLLGLEKRIQWRDCAQTEDEEKTDIEEFKASFKPFDFTLD